MGKHSVRAWNGNQIISCLFEYLVCFWQVGTQNLSTWQPQTTGLLLPLVFSCLYSINIRPYRLTFIKVLFLSRVNLLYVRP